MGKAFRQSTVLTFEQILSYLYSGSIDLKSMKNENILQLVAAAKKVKLARLRWLCEHYLQENLTMDNVFSILKHSHEMKEADVKSFCLAYAVQYYNKFIANKDGVRLLGIDLFQEVASASAEKGAAKKLPNDPAPPCTLVKDFNAIYNEMVNADGFVKCGGQTIKFHKVHLSFSHVLKQPPGCSWCFFAGVCQFAWEQSKPGGLG